MPPMTKRSHPRRSGGASSSPALIATGLPPQSADRSRANSPARQRQRTARVMGGGRRVRIESPVSQWVFGVRSSACYSIKMARGMFEVSFGGVS